MVFPPSPIDADKAPGPPTSSTEHPNHHNDLATAINDTVTELSAHADDSDLHGIFTYEQDVAGGAPVGAVGETWHAPDTGESFYWSTAADDWLQFATTEAIEGPPGEGVPAGGTAGQVLGKVDATDRNTEWIDVITGDVTSILQVTQAEYDALTPPDASTMYLVVG